MFFNSFMRFHSMVFSIISALLYLLHLLIISLSTFCIHFIYDKYCKGTTGEYSSAEYTARNQETLKRFSEITIDTRWHSPSKETKTQMRTTAEHIKYVSGVHLGFLEGRGPDFRKRANQYETKKKRIQLIYRW